MIDENDELNQENILLPGQMCYDELEPLTIEEKTIIPKSIWYLKSIVLDVIAQKITPLIVPKPIGPAAIPAKKES